MIESKSYEDWFLGLYRAMFVDIVRYIPSLQSDCRRDYKRLLSAIEHHGIPFVLDTMVQYAKHLDRCLADGCLTRSGLCQFGGFKRGSAVPKLFKGLHLRIFDRFGKLRSDPDVQSIRFLRQLLGCFKSFRIDCPNSRIYENVQEFFETDDEVASPSLSWDGDGSDFSSSRDLQFRDHVLHESGSEPNLFGSEDPVLPFGRAELDVVQRTADIFCFSLGRFDPLEWKTRHGPGAVSDIRGSDLVSKYEFPAWPDRLEEVFPFADFGFANYGLWVDALKHEDWLNECKTSTEPMSRLLVVPKTYRAPRLIASEPSAFQWAQQSVRDFLMSRVRHTPFAGAISFRDQSANGRLALGASHSGSHATIDLSSASDRISCWVVERLFRVSPTLLRALHSCRTRWIRQDLDRKQPKYKRLRKFSTMGSAVTFPVQTILFTVLAVSGVLLRRNLRVSRAAIRRVCREVQVFGDDIIVPEDSWDVTQALLTTFGLKVNLSKTFGTGKFRESCGVDAFDGHNVSRISILAQPAATKPEKVLSSVDVHNNLLLGGYECAAEYVRNAVSRLKRYRFPRVVPFSGTIGWYTFGAIDNSDLRSRWNDSLHRREFWIDRPRSTTTRSQTSGSSMVHQYFTEASSFTGFIAGERLGLASRSTPFALRKAWAPIY